MSDQINLAAAGNVLAPALAVLRKLGFKLWDRKEESFSYTLKQ